MYHPKVSISRSGCQQSPRMAIDRHLVEHTDMMSSLGRVSL